MRRDKPNGVGGCALPQLTGEPFKFPSWSKAKS